MLTEEQAEKLINAAFHREFCPSTDDLLDFVWQLQDETAAQATQKHISLCTYCQKDVAALRQESEFIENTSAANEKTGQWHLPVFFGRLSLGSAMRNQAPSKKPIIYEIDELGWTLILRVRKHTSGGKLLGKLHVEVNGLSLGDQAKAELVNENYSSLAQLDVSGAFEFNAIVGGIYQMRIQTADAQASILDIEVPDMTTDE